jgi:plastocyanin
MNPGKHRSVDRMDGVSSSHARRAPEGTMPMNRWMALALAGGLFLVACGGDEGTTMIDGREANDHGTEEVAGQTSIEFEMDDSYFEPTVLEDEPGQVLTLEAFNEGEAEHNLSIADQGINVDLAPGEETSIKVTFPGSGTLVFECKYHAGQGMIGALEAS